MRPSPIVSATPRSRRVAGVLALLLLAACDQADSVPGPGAGGRGGAGAGGQTAGGAGGGQAAGAGGGMALGGAAGHSSAGAGGAVSSGGAGGQAGRGGGSAGHPGGGCTLSATYTCVDGSGATIPFTRTVLTPPSSYRHENLLRYGPSGNLASCMPALPACPSSSQLDVSDVESAVADPDVQAALASPTGASYGNQSSDAPVFTFVRDSGGSFSVGSDCAASSGGCTAAPAGVRALVQLVRALVTQQSADASCAGVD